MRNRPHGDDLHTYCKNHTTNDKFYWKCTHPGCTHVLYDTQLLIGRFAFCSMCEETTFVVKDTPPFWLDDLYCPACLDNFVAEVEPAQLKRYPGAWGDIVLRRMHKRLGL